MSSSVRKPPVIPHAVSPALALARGLGLDERSRAIGFAHARDGLPWCCPDALDLLAYSLGHAQGSADRAASDHAARHPGTPPAKE